MADEHVRAIVREELAKASPKPNQASLYKHTQRLIRDAARTSAELNDITGGEDQLSSLQRPTSSSYLSPGQEAGGSRNNIYRGTPNSFQA